MQRRELLKYSAGLALTGLVSRAPAAATAVQDALDDTLLLSAASDRAGGHYLCGQYLDGTLAFALPVSERAHACQYRPHTADAVFFSRRPGHHLHIVDTELGELKHSIKSLPGYHYYGHGVYSADGARLYTTENDASSARGVIGVYAVDQHYRRIGEWDLQGTGPHELAWLPGTDTLAVALGGILTALDSERSKLNLDTMQPALLLVDSQRGSIEGRWRPPHHQLSLRHLAVNSGGEVIVGAQYQGPASDARPLVFRLADGKFSALRAAPDDWQRQHQYIASVAVDREQRYALTTSPRGGVVSLWDLRADTVRHHALADVAGAHWCNRARGFLVTNGYGEIARLQPDHPDVLERLFMQTRLRWDNHLQVSA